MKNDVFSCKSLLLLDLLEDFKNQKIVSDHAELSSKIDSLLEVLVEVVYQDCDKGCKAHVH
jgi:hypothetical protein